MSGWRVGANGDMPDVVTQATSAPARDIAGDILVGVVSGVAVALVSYLLWHRSGSRSSR